MAQFIKCPLHQHESLIWDSPELTENKGKLTKPWMCWHTSLKDVSRNGASLELTDSQPGRISELLVQWETLTQAKNGEIELDTPNIHLWPLHTHLHSHVHTYKCIHTHAHTYTLKSEYTLTHSAHLQMHTHLHTHVHTYKSIQTHMHTYKCIHICIHMCIHKNVYAHTCIHMCALTNACIPCIHLCTHTPAPSHRKTQGGTL